MQPAHPEKKHIRIYCPQGHTRKVWAEQNRDRIRSFLLEVTVSPYHLHLDLYYKPEQETLIIEEILRYAGVIDVCSTGSVLD